MFSRPSGPQVNNVCVPPPPPGQSAKAFFLMEMPGFSIDPNAFDPSKFKPGIMMSPDCATSSLCDRVPALAPCFYDTGNHISFFWDLLLETFTVEGDFIKKNSEVEARYERAIEMLYGSKEGYKNQEKTPFLYTRECRNCATIGDAPKETRKVSRRNAWTMKKTGQATTRKVPLRSSMRWSKPTPSTTTSAFK